MRTVSGRRGVFWPRVGGCVSEMWVLYHAVPFRIPVQAESMSMSTAEDCSSNVQTPVVPVIRGLSLLYYRSSLPV